MTKESIRIGTRGSALALWQANYVAEQLAAIGVRSEVVKIASRGDQQPDAPIATLGSDGVFTKELQKAVLDGRIDIAVHSLKDLPTDVVKGLVLAAVPPRESPHDVLVSREGLPFARLPGGAKIGTGSSRRRAQLLHVRADLRMLDIRGNVETRLRKLHDGEFDALNFGARWPLAIRARQSDYGDPTAVAHAARCRARSARTGNPRWRSCDAADSCEN